MQYGKHALDIIASSQDSLRLSWLEQLFSSAVESDREVDVEEGINLQSAIRLIQSVNPGVSSSKVEHRFKELQRVRERTCGAGVTPLDHPAGECENKCENKRQAARNMHQAVTKQDFIEVFHDFCTRPEIYFLLVQFSSNKEFLDTKDLMRFLEAEQGMLQVGNLCTHAHTSTQIKLHIQIAKNPVSQKLILTILMLIPIICVFFFPSNFSCTLTLPCSLCPILGERGDQPEAHPIP